MADFLEHHYSRPTTPAGAGFDLTILNGVEIQNEVEFSASATLGEADICKVVVDDPAGEWDFAGHRRWFIAEKAISSNTLVWTGYIGQQHVHRRESDTGSKIVGTGRVWELDLVELNAIANFRIITGADGSRDAESAGSRLTWLLASDYLSTVHDNGLVVYPSTAMDAVDYRGQTAADVLRDLSLATGYNWFVYYDEPQPAGDEVSLFFDDSNASTAYSSFIRISNVLADVAAAPNNTFAPINPVLLRDPTDVAAGIYMPYDGGALYDYDYDTSFEFGFRDKAAPSANVKTEAKAQRIIDRLLIQHSEQDDKVTCSIILPASQLNDIKHGHRMQAKFNHFPAPYNDWTWYRVTSKSFSRPENGATDRYVVDLDLSPMVPVSVVDATCTGTLMQSNQALVTNGQFSFSSALTAGRTAVLIGYEAGYVNGPLTGPPGYTKAAEAWLDNNEWGEQSGSWGGWVAIWYRINQPGDSNAVTFSSFVDYAWGGEFECGFSVVDTGENNDQPNESEYPCGGAVNTQVGDIIVGATLKHTGTGIDNITPDSGTTEIVDYNSGNFRWWWAGRKVAVGGTDSVSGTGLGGRPWCGVTVVFRG